MTKFLDYEGLKIFATKLKNLISAVQTTANTAASSATTANTAAATAKKRADDAYKVAEAIDSDYVSKSYFSEMDDTAELVWADTQITNKGIIAPSIKQKGYENVHNMVMGTDGIPHQIGTDTFYSSICPIDNNGNVPLAHLGNLDTTLFEVVETRPSKLADIKKHIYLIKDLSGANNQYTEWIYTGGIGSSDTYDATKWEKLGNFSANIDLSGYQTTAEAAKTFSYQAGTTAIRLNLLANNNTQIGTIVLPAATIDTAGLMTSAMVTKLNGIASGANAYTLPTASATVLGGVKVGANLVISSGVLNVDKITDSEINALFT